jgi:hypothetical protein
MLRLLLIIAHSLDFDGITAGAGINIYSFRLNAIPFSGSPGTLR